MSGQGEKLFPSGYGFPGGSLHGGDQEHEVGADFERLLREHVSGFSEDSSARGLEDLTCCGLDRFLFFFRDVTTILPRKKKKKKKFREFRDFDFSIEDFCLFLVKSCLTFSR